jgi:hypothetical protein
LNDLIRFLPLDLEAFIVNHLWQRHSDSVSDKLYRIAKPDTFNFLHEIENVTALVTAEAMEDLPVRIDVEARSSLFVKGAQGREVGSGSL